MRCDPAVLRTLVEQSAEPSDDARLIFAHLEECCECRSLLRAIAGNESWWSDVQQWLGDDSCAAAPAGHDAIAAVSPADLSFLQPPAHPEMLGRMGRYDIEGVIGRGGMGIVFRGFDSDLQRCVAIKTLSPRYGCDADARQRFAREAQAAASVAHENVVPIFNVQAEHDPPFLVMPYVAGITLERLVKQYGPPDAITVLRIAHQIAGGLRAAHGQDLIHRDIKPGNILVAENVHRVWITDFGLARAVDDATLTHTGVIAGTPQFMSPEQSRGERLDARSDLFSLGALLYYLSTGRAPFEAESTLAVLHQVVAIDPPSLAAARPDLPPAFITLVGDLLRKQPSQRPRDAAAVSKRIAVAIAQRNSGLTVHHVQRRKRVWRLTGTAAAAAFLGLAIIGAERLRPANLDASAVGPAAAAPPPTVGSAAMLRALPAMAQRIDLQLTQPEGANAIRRAERIVEGLQQSPMQPFDLRVPLSIDPTASSQPTIAAMERARTRLAEADAEPPASVLADPTQPLIDDLHRIGRQLGRIATAEVLIP